MVTKLTTISTDSSPRELEKWYKTWLNEQKSNGFILEKPSDRSLTTFYAENVVNGNIKASKKNILSCQRHLNDLKRAGTEDFPYVFDEAKAYRPVHFIERYCKPSKGAYRSLVMQPWQHFVIGSLYGWVRVDTGHRRFREGLNFVGRKNGKTTKISGLATYAICKDEENGAHVYVLANAKEQARILFDESRAMIQASPSLSRHLRENQNGIFHDKTASKIEPRASDSKTLDGLNVHLGIFDEIHGFTDYDLINVIKRSRAARTQPLIVYITTAGYELNGPLADYYEDAIDILNGTRDDEQKFYYIAELDSVDEIEYPSEWIKANPNMGVTMDLLTLVRDYNSDKNNPQEKNDWITKQFNIFTDNQQQSFVELATIDSNSKEIDISTLKGRRCAGGYDLSQTEDLTSACLEFPLDDGNVFVLTHSWVPEAKVERNNEKIPYRDWEKAGYLTIIPGPIIKHEYVYDWFAEQGKLYNIESIGFDPYNAYRLNEDLESCGFKMFEVRQGHATLNAPLKNVRELLLEGKVVFNKNKMFRWYMNNVKTKPDRNGNIMPTKQGRYRKIDGFAAFLTAHAYVFSEMHKPKPSGTITHMSISDLMNIGR